MVTQRWRSGRTRTTRNRVTWEHVRGFESLSLRHKKGSFIRGLFLWQKNSNQRGIRGKEAREGASGLQAHIIYKLQKGKVSIVSNLIINTTINFVQPAGSILLFDFFYAYVIMII